MCIDVIINSLITFSREYFGLKTFVVGGRGLHSSTSKLNLSRF